MRKLYILGLMALACSYLPAQNCTNAASSACTTTITQDFSSSNGGFSSTDGFTYNSGAGNFEVTAVKNSTYTLTSGVYSMTTNGGVVGFSSNAGTTGAAVSGVIVKVLNAATEAVLFQCNAPFAAQVCINYSGVGLSTGAPVKYQFVFQTNNGNSGAGQMAFDNFSNGASASSLPVKLETFDALKEFNAVKLLWNTSNEIGIHSYEVQKSNDGSSFWFLGSVRATNATEYSYTDSKVAQDNNFYRLKLIDINGSFNLSSVIHVRMGILSGIQTYPNPVKSSLQVQHMKAASGSHLQIANAQGSILRDTKVPKNTTVSSVNMSAFPAGIYYIIFKCGDQTLTKQIIKN